MLRHLKISSYTKVIFFLILMLIIFSIINVFISIKNTVDVLKSYNINHSDIIRYFIFNIFCEIVLIMVFGLLILYFVKKIHDKSLKHEIEKARVVNELEIANEIIQKDEMILFQKDKIEQQNKEIIQQKSLVDKLYMEALENNKNKTDFFSNIAHDLKTPLTVILSTIQLLNMELSKNANKESYAKTYKKYLNIIKQNSFRIVRLINSLLQITKIEAGFMDINLQNVDIVKLIREICFSISEYLNHKNITFEFCSNVDKKVIAIDPYKLENIILNLLSNAAKFTQPGGRITLRIHDKNSQVMISVEDTGAGIPKERLNVIFERFKQARTHNTKHHEGVGIGLSLVKMLVELHNGQIKVESEVGKGTKFTVLLPAITVPESHPGDIPVTQNHNRIIEAVDIEFSEIYNLN